MITAELQARSHDSQNPHPFFYFVPPAMHVRGSELKFSSINNIHSLSLTISQQ